VTRIVRGAIAMERLKEELSQVPKGLGDVERRVDSVRVE